MQVSFMNNPWLITAICALFSYMLCGIPFGKILAAQLSHVDLQKVGSGNIGTTNALRAAGPKVAALTLLCDVLKGTLCVVFCRTVIAGFAAGGGAEAVAPGTPYDWTVAVIALACVLGHMFSPYLGFHGGKSIAVGVGVFFGIAWPYALLHLAIFIVLVALTKYVSVGSIATAGLVIVTACLYFPQASWAFKLILGGIGFLVVWAHRANIKKLMAGKESKLSFTKCEAAPIDEAGE